MEDRISLILFYTALIAALFTGILTCLISFLCFRQQAVETFRLLAAQAVSVYSSPAGSGGLSKLSIDEIDVELIDSDGSILYSCDGASDRVQLSDCAELIGAQQSGSAYTSRKSPQTGTVCFYYAVSLENGSMLRLSAPHAFVYRSFWQAFSYIILVFLALIVLSLLASHLLARRLLRPIRQLPKTMESRRFPTDETAVYPELVPLVQEVLTQRSERVQMRQEFTANVSHELKTPLTTISGYSEMLEAGFVKPEDITKFAGKIKHEAQRMQMLVSDIIELSHLDNQSALEDPEPVSLLSLVTECLEQLSPAMQKKGLHTCVEGKGFSVSGNSRQLWELVYNLIDNACRYNRDGGTIRISADHGTLSVADTGIGIPAEHQERIFERFYRVDKSHSRASGGTGLGLSIVKHVAELHNAKIELDSTERIGTEIRVVFPPHLICDFT